MINEFDDYAKSLVKRFNQLESDRSQWNNHWSDINRFVEPATDQFYGNYNYMGGRKLNGEVYDSTATLALPKYAAGIESVVTPRTSQWHTLSTTSQVLDQIPAVRLYFQQCTDILFAMRYASKANFSSQLNEVYKSLGKYGTACLFVQDDKKGLIYKAINVAELFIAQNNFGQIDTIFRSFHFTAMQAFQTWGKDKMPDQIMTALENAPDRKFQFVHIVQPNKNILHGSKSAKGMKYESIYLCIDTQTIMNKGGYTTMPYCVVRTQVDIDEVYGRSPAMNVLPDIKTLQEVSRLDLNARQLNITPPLLAPGGTLNAFNMIPGAINQGFVENGQPTIMPLNTGAQINVSNDLKNQLQTTIQDAFSIPLFQMLAQQATSQMTATEVLLRNQEKAALLAPAAGRIQSELLGTMIEREMDLLSKMGLLPDMPDELKEINGFYEVEYTGPLNQIQRSGQAISMLQLIGNLGTIAQFYPDVTKLIDFEAMLRKIADITNVPVEVIRTPEQIQIMQQADAQQAQIQQMLQAAPVAASSAKDLAQAQQLYSQPTPGIQ